MAQMVRRSFCTIWPGHLTGDWLSSDESDDESRLTGYYNFLVKNIIWKQMGFTGVALALERGDDNGLHIQGYFEHSQKRWTTLGKHLSVQPTAFSTVVDSKGAFQYCTGTGVHTGKPALARFQYGEFKLHGDTAKADLRMLVGLALDGAKPQDLFREHPYAWCVHRDRMMKFYEDQLRWRVLGPRQGPPKVGFADDEET